MHFKISIIIVDKIQTRFTEFSNLIILSLMSLGLLTCSVEPKADKIYKNGNILSGLVDGKRLKYIATKDNIILDAGIGSYEHFIASKTKVIDLNLSLIHI